MFKVRAPYERAGDQATAVTGLTDALASGEKWMTLLGITGSGKSAVMAWTIEATNRPALVIAPNKSLAAQLAGELRELLPENKVCYFVSYYDYYQPEAYVPSSDMFIEKEAQINQEIDRLRHEATAALLNRRDVVVVASVSCVYGLGAPESYLKHLLYLKKGEEWSRRDLSLKLAEIGYTRNDTDTPRGTFRVRGDTFDIHLSGEETLRRVVFDDEEITGFFIHNPITGENTPCGDDLAVWPARHYTSDPATLTNAVSKISSELQERLTTLRSEGKLLEAQRLEQRSMSDIDMLTETGGCAGVENYSRHLDGREAGEPPYTLLDYFPEDFVVYLDESHVTIPQLGACFAGDLSRKTTLIEHGFRLPSAADNRPLRFEEFSVRAPQVVMVSATPGKFERENSSSTIELLVRPTGLLDPQVIVQSSTGQLQDLVARIRERSSRNERVLVTCITKDSAEKLTDYLLGEGVRSRYIHSDVEVVERIELVRELRLGMYDVLVGVNLLREGIDMPEVSLVAVMDADTQGFLRSETALIQTIGRAARHINGTAVLYAQNTTEAMRKAIEETDRRRSLQAAHNTKHGIVPVGVSSGIRDNLLPGAAKKASNVRGSGQAPGVVSDWDELDDDALKRLLLETEERMLVESALLRFEEAAAMRDKAEVIARRLAQGS